MDRTELKEILKSFQEKCAEKGKPLSEICIVEAYPGDVSTSYIVQVKASWIDDMSCSDALDFLFDVLWETTSIEIRKKVFSIQVLGNKEEPHCLSEEKV